MRVFPGLLVFLIHEKAAERAGILAGTPSSEAGTIERGPAVRTGERLLDLHADRTILDGRVAYDR